MNTRIHRRHLVIAAAVAALSLSSCGGGSLGGEETADEGPVKIGLLVPQSGVYKSLGDDMKDGFEVYLAEHGGKLGLSGHGAMHDPRGACDGRATRRGPHLYSVDLEDPDHEAGMRFACKAPRRRVHSNLGI